VIIGAISGALWFLVFLCLLLLIMRKRSADSWLDWNLRLLLLALVCDVFTIGLLVRITDNQVLSQGGWLMGALWGTLAFLGLYVMYMPFYYVILTSLSVKTLVILHHEASGQMPLAQLRERFVSERFVTGRLDTMVANGYLTNVGGGAYALTSKGRKIAQAFIRIKSLWKLGPGG